MTRRRFFAGLLTGAGLTELLGPWLIEQTEAMEAGEVVARATARRGLERLSVEARVSAGDGQALTTDTERARAMARRILTSRLRQTIARS